MLFAHKYSNVSKITLIFIMTGMLLAGCSKQLDIKPEVFISPEELYKDEAGVKSGIVGIYRQLLELKRSDYVIVGMVGTDEGKTTLFVPTWGTYWQNFCAVNTYSTLMTAQNDVVQGFWIDCYKGITNANIAIRSIPGVDISDVTKNQALGEARFMRALFYFYLVQAYGAVPLPTEEVSTVADQKGGLPRSSEEDVYKLITTDLQFAVTNLTAKGGEGNTGRATKEAATGLLGKVYLTRKDWSNAKTTLEPLLTASNTTLMANYADLFVEANENNIESLFEVQFSNENNNTSNLANNLGCWQINSPELSGAGGHVIIPTDYFFDSFEEGDKRKDATFRTLFFDKDGNPVDYSWWSDVGKPHIKKFDITKGVSVSGGQSSRNLYYLRLADVILMYAEAQNELGNTAVAMQNLNRIRNRAGLQNYETAHGATLTQDQLRKELMLERMRELGFEGWRWFDLKRTGTLVAEVKAHNLDAAPNITEKHLLYPIPTREFESNQSLKLSDQNPGY